MPVGPSRVPVLLFSSHLLEGLCVAAFKPTFLLLLSTFWPGAPHKQILCHSPSPSIFSAKVEVPERPLGPPAVGLWGSAEGGCCRASRDASDAVTGLFSTCPPPGQAAGEAAHGRSPCSRCSTCGAMRCQPCPGVCPLAAPPLRRQPENWDYPGG